ncbi:uncharacterized protein LOC130780080 [Actinidia eriantha]|uniref:uncharacterized protein LOC130780080 n=1 Tax=Actinidia eriantha TaxID=165200 RepID=UPI002585B168|nr:uncharacterized protein LOC130780080 [Actinidia eriantha]XP_057495019.1 uncharacterized protein LOC130780080 [Actinidia eriantha]XP_057495020.1 uncharacterized protein LOC130780080 [Actinidia eriantha]
MWGSFSNSVMSFGRKKIFVETSRDCLDFSDDETSSNGNAGDGLECPICWESFNIVENVPYVLWCGHTVCKNCVLGINCAALKFSNQLIEIPFFISCPWCHLLTLRLVYKGNLKFPRKNFFLLWMVESLNGDRMKSPLSASVNNQSVWSPRSPSFLANQASNNYLRRALHNHRLGRLESNNNNGRGRANDSLNVETPHLSLHKSLDFFIRFTRKFPLVILLLLIVFVAFPAIAAILVLYLLITVLLALPSFLVLYFAYPGLDWLIREITS